jgi:hypothetical protein
MVEWLKEQEEGGREGGVEGGKEGRRTFYEPVTGKAISATLLDGQPRDMIEWVLASTFFR